TKRVLTARLNWMINKKKALLPLPEPVLKTYRGMNIPVCEPTQLGNEKKYVKACMDTNWISSKGAYISKFESMFARKVGAGYGVGVLNGTVALHLALAALDIGPGDEVIIPTFTMIATPNSVRYTGASLVLVDSELKTWNIDASKIEEKITKRTKAIMPVHTYGHPCDMDQIMRLAKKYKLYVIEDAAEAHGAIYKGKKIGSIGNAACFSFYANKIITTGEGGMVTTNDKKLAEKMQLLKNHAFSHERHFWHKLLGFNYRMTNIQAAIGLAQTENFEKLAGKRIHNAMLYNSLLGDVEEITLPPSTRGIKNVYWMYGILLKDWSKVTRDTLRYELANRGIETRTFFIPIHLQPIYRGWFKGKYPNSEYLCTNGLYLPSSTSLTEKQVRYVAGTLKEIFAKRR
ncbi:MAG: DegT/DnrJ/EryC1/StrS family aminotransferase, partial [bacterium]